MRVLRERREALKGRSLTIRKRIAKLTRRSRRG
jgi:hypothetical protein